MQAQTLLLWGGTKLRPLWKRRFLRIDLTYMMCNILIHVVSRL